MKDAIQYAIDNNVAPILSTSYGECETNVTLSEFNSQNTLFQQAAAQGITILAATGNSGAAACDTTAPAQKGLAVYSQRLRNTLPPWAAPNSIRATVLISIPAITPKVVPQHPNIPEVAWNDGNLAATGGGVSTLVSKPTWQTGTGVPADGHRDLPDVAFAASIQNYGFVYCSEGSCTNGFLNSGSSPAITGGTTAGASNFAGVLALLVQKTASVLVCSTPNLYSLASISSNVFHDVTAGNNQVTCQGGTTGCPAGNSTGTGSYGYSANAGYDLVTGWGSIDSNNFVEQWSGDINITATPATLHVPTLDTPPVNSVTSAITVSPVNNFSGVISFSCSVASSISANISCAMEGNTVTNSGTTHVTITAGNLAQTIKPRRNIPVPPSVPPAVLAWLGISLAACAMVFVSRKYRLVTVRTAYTAGVAALRFSLWAL